MKRLLVLLIAFSFLLIAGTFDSTTKPAGCDEDFIEINIQVSPNTLVLASEGTWVTVHADIAYDEVAKSTLALNDIPCVTTKEDNRGELVVKFNLDDVKEIVEPPEAELTLIGATTGGQYFRGVDIVRVIEGGPRN